MEAPSSLKFTNSSPQAIKIILEPWAEEYRVEPGVEIEIVAEEPHEACIEIKYDGEDIIVFGWSDNINVLVDGKKLEPYFESSAQSSINELLKDLKSEDYRVVRKAIKALGKINDIRAVEAIISVLGLDHPADNDSKINFEAMIALKKMGEISLQPTIHALEKGNDNWKRYFAAWSLGLRKDTRVIEPLINILLNDTDTNVLGGAITALTSMYWSETLDLAEPKILSTLKQVKEKYTGEKNYFTNSVNDLIESLEGDH